MIIYKRKQACAILLHCLSLPSLTALPSSSCFSSSLSLSPDYAAVRWEPRLVSEEKETCHHGDTANEGTGKRGEEQKNGMKEKPCVAHVVKL